MVYSRQCIATVAAPPRLFVLVHAGTMPCCSVSRIFEGVLISCGLVLVRWVAKTTSATSVLSVPRQHLVLPGSACRSHAGFGWCQIGADAR
jgi:hypothetical protein